MPPSILDLKTQEESELDIRRPEMRLQKNIHLLWCFIRSSRHNQCGKEDAGRLSAYFLTGMAEQLLIVYTATISKVVTVGGAFRRPPRADPA
jgi:hypothetical protein